MESTWAVVIRQILKVIHHMYINNGAPAAV